MKNARLCILYYLLNDSAFICFRLVQVGNLEAAVSLLLSTHPESDYFYANALRAVALSSAVSKSLLELAVKVSTSFETAVSNLKPSWLA